VGWRLAEPTIRLRMAAISGIKPWARTSIGWTALCA
jgi:hypothetical protein